MVKPNLLCFANMVQEKLRERWPQEQSSGKTLQYRLRKWFPWRRYIKDGEIKWGQLLKGIQCRNKQKKA